MRMHVTAYPLQLLLPGTTTAAEDTLRRRYYTHLRQRETGMSDPADT